jgi:hypothetical protein
MPHMSSTTHSRDDSQHQGDPDRSVKPAAHLARTNLFGAPLLIGRQVRQVRAVPLAGVYDVHASLARRRKHAAA